MREEYITLELHKILELLAERCSNEASKRLALSIQPSSQLDEVRAEVNKVFAAFNMSARFGSPVFMNLPDGAVIAKRALNGSELSLRELLDVSRLLSQTEALMAWRRQFEEDFELDYLFEQLFDNRWLSQKILGAVISEDEISDSASPELSAIRRKLALAGQRIKETLDSMIRSSSAKSYLQDSLVTIRDDRYVLPVKSEHKNSVPGLVHDTSASGQTYFIEPMAVVEANNEIRILKGKEQEEIQRIIRELSQDCAGFAQQLISDYNAFVRLNLYFAKANLGADMSACMPTISDDGEIILKKARHPLIDKKRVVPIDFSIGSDYSALIITGPNTGGKTVTLKTVGLLTLMVMCGLLIPVSDGSKITVFEDVLVDIGDKQSIEESLSTFSSHMTAIVDILKRVGPSSLVLIDELGSGTDPVEGAALAVAIIKKIKDAGARLVTTTHYQELKMFALETPGVENASCEFDLRTLLPTYRLIIGSPGKSNAFAISKRLGLGEDIIEQARALLGEESSHFEDVIKSLEQARLEYEENARLAEQYKRRSEELKAELEEEKSRLRLESQTELDRTRRQAREIIDRVSLRSQQLMDELVELKKQRDKEDFSKLVESRRQSYRSAVNSLYDEAAGLGKLTEESYVLPRPLKKGDDVLIRDSNKSGVLISLPDGSGNCIVQLGIMKTKVHISKLRLVESGSAYNGGQLPKRRSEPSSSGIESRATRKPELELDIRGYTVDEGIYELDSFIDRAIMSGNRVVTIIHGKGTGALKTAVRSHLKKHPQVLSSRKGVYGEGEDGVTIVELR